ncbi:MAG: VOC family protein [Pseudomonadota bacterium]
MRLEHINIVVSEIANSLAFYQAAFPSWRVRGEGVTDWFGVKRKWVHFGDDHNYITLNDSGTGTNRNLATNALGIAHFAFETNNLKRLIARLQDAGFTPSHAGAPNEHRENIYFIDPDGLEVEFVQYLSDVPSERNIYL